MMSIIFQQMGFFDDVYQILQDFYLVMRAARKRGTDAPLTEIQEWEKILKSME